MKKNDWRVPRVPERDEKKYADLKSQIETVGFILQGSINERWIPCGNPGCKCKKDPGQRHGPYHQLSWKENGKTVSVYLTEEQVRACDEWISNNRKLEKIISEMRVVSRRVACKMNIVPK